MNTSWKNPFVVKVIQTVPNRALSDFLALFAHYADSDLHVAVARPPRGPWKTPPSRHGVRMKTGVSLLHFMSTRGTQEDRRNVRESLRALFGLDDIREENYGFISNSVTPPPTPGSQRNCIEAEIKHRVRASERPRVSCVSRKRRIRLSSRKISDSCHLPTDSQPKQVADLAGIRVSSLKDWHEVILLVSSSVYGPRAIAIKNLKCLHKAY